MGYTDHFSRNYTGTLLKFCEGDPPVAEVDDVCRVIMFDWARPRARFMYRSAAFELNYKSQYCRYKERWEPAEEVPDQHIRDCFNFMINAGWIRYSFWRRETERHFYFTTAGIRRWEDVEREPFLAKSEVYLAECRRLEREAENIRRFGVPWNVHEDGVSEWDE